MLVLNKYNKLTNSQINWAVSSDSPVFSLFFTLLINLFCTSLILSLHLINNALAFLDSVSLCSLVTLKQIFDNCIFLRYETIKNISLDIQLVLSELKYWGEIIFINNIKQMTKGFKRRVITQQQSICVQQNQYKNYGVTCVFTVKFN